MHTGQKGQDSNPKTLGFESTVLTTGLINVKGAYSNLTLLTYLNNEI